MNEIKPEYEYLNKAFEKSKVKSILATGYNKSSTVNMSDIFTILIQNAGRFCERYASDILIDINSIQKDLANLNNTDEYTQIYAIGIRKNGVDGNAYITNRLNSAQNDIHAYAICNEYYRKLFILKITKADNDITCELKEVSPYDIQESYKKASVH